MTQKDIHLEKLRDVIRRKHFALSTERTYVLWVAKFWDAARSMAPDMTREKKVEVFLTAEARRGCAASTQNQAFNAIVFFFNSVLGTPLGDVKALRAKRSATLRVAPSRSDTIALLKQVPDVAGYPTKLISHLLYGCGLRVSEPLNLRIKDVDFENSRLLIWEAKGGKSRIVGLPCALVFEIRQQMKLARAIWERDNKVGIPVPLPGLLANKARCNAKAWSWYWLFPAHGTCVHPRTGEIVRWRCHQANVQRAVKYAARKIGLDGVITPHNLRHAYATHVIDAGASVRDVQSALGHKSLDTTMGYVHPDGMRVHSPLDQFNPNPATSALGCEQGGR